MLHNLEGKCEDTPLESSTSPGQQYSTEATKSKSIHARARFPKRSSNRNHSMETNINDNMETNINDNIE